MRAVGFLIGMKGYNQAPSPRLTRVLYNLLILSPESDTNKYVVLFHQIASKFSLLMSHSRLPSSHWSPMCVCLSDPILDLSLAEDPEGGLGCPMVRHN